MKKAMKYISTSLAALTLCVSILPSTASVYASTKGNPTPKTISTTDFPDVHLNDLTSEQRRKLTVIFTIGEELALTDNNELYLKHDTKTSTTLVAKTSPLSSDQSQITIRKSQHQL
ncbi:hypothetical protein [Streptococcus ruminantium]|uniref:hypothetical protein n=1 Tax=Streptococcus ruminantium TaxID=1917441 RepID=UPI0012DCAFAB|nr:hypothetical protein [Streptococcus ruminantium]